MTDAELLDRCGRLGLPAFGASDLFVRIPLDIVDGYDASPQASR